MQDNLRDHIKTLHWPEWPAKEQREMGKWEGQIYKKTFKWLFSFLGVKRSGRLKAPKGVGRGPPPQSAQQPKVRGLTQPGGKAALPRNCEKLRIRLLRLPKVAWRKNRRPFGNEFPHCQRVLHSEDSSDLKDYCTMLLLKVERKVFFGILARSLNQFLIKYIDTSQTLHTKVEYQSSLAVLRWRNTSKSCTL